MIIQGNNRDTLCIYPDNYFDAVVCDPPYGLGKEPDALEVLRHWLAGDDYQATGGGFMGKSWDSFVPGPATWREVMRVLKPGGHAVVFGGTRTYDLMVLALRIAGFEVRDQLDWLYGTGFPKSTNISKAIDRAAGAEREVIGTKRGIAGENLNDIVHGRDVRDGGGMGAYGVGAKQVGVDVPITAPATDDAKKYDGLGSALKPAHEPIALVRKPFKGPLFRNVVANGTGGLNIDGCRIGSAPIPSVQQAGGSPFNGGEATGEVIMVRGRWPANVILDEAAGAVLDEQSGTTKSGTMRANQRQNTGGTVYGARTLDPSERTVTHGDSGGASRFFYCAKASKADRERGLADMALRTGGECTDRKDGSAGLDSPRAGAGRGGDRANTHPTVKPTPLMQWLVRLVTLPGQRVLDPFAGSGSTGVACAIEGREFVGLELSAEYCEIARKRIASVPTPG